MLSNRRSRSLILKPSMRFIIKPIAWVLIACLVNNPIYGFYLITGLLFFKPFPAFADEFLNKAAEGQSFGTQIMSDYSIPSVNSSTGQMTLTNGVVAGQTVQQNELFQQIQPGSMDGIAASYGDAGALGTQVNNNLGSLTTGTSTHAYAYQTLMGANTSMPNIYNDPMWKTSDDIYSLKSPLIKDMFNGCEKKTNWTEKDCPIHREDLKTCKKTMKTESCKVTRQITVSSVPTLSLVSQSVTFDGVAGTSAFAGNFSDTTDTLKNITVGSGYVYTTSTGCHNASYSMTIHVNDANLIDSAAMKNIAADGDVTVKIDGAQIYSNGFGCPDWYDSNTAFNTDIKPYLTNGDHTITVYVAQTDDTSAHAIVGFEVRTQPNINEQFLDFPAGCRQRLFDIWPPTVTAPDFISTGSLTDDASTKWWQCTEASNSKVIEGVTITPELYASSLGAILPDAPATPPAAICYAAETRVPGHVSLPCFTDKDGYPVCPEYDYNNDEHTSCDQFAANSQCNYVGESCADGAANPITGACQEFIVTYDCGTDYPAKCDQVNEGEKTICDSPIRCLGGECVDQATESNKDFIRAATALQVLNQAQQSNGCDPSTGDCALFAGEPKECQMADLSILGSVDCCNMPLEGSFIDYMKFAASSWELADTSVEMYQISQNGAEFVDFVGAWRLTANNTVFSTTFTTINDGWTAVTDTFTSMGDSVASMLGEGLSDTLSTVSLSAIKQQAMQWMSDWVVEKFGAAAGEALFSYAAGAGPVTNAATGAMEEAGTVTGMGSMLSSIINVVGIIYAIYQIAKMVVQLIFACTKAEVELNMLKQQKLCTAPTEIGTYCSADVLGICVARKEAYCCFSSPFSRIFQEQARPQLGKTFGDPKEPTCEGLPVSQIAKLDFNKMDFSEWIDMLKIANQLPGDSQIADSMYDKANITKGKLPNAAKDNAKDRLNTQTEGSDIDAVRQHLLDNL